MKFLWKFLECEGMGNYRRRRSELVETAKALAPGWAAYKIRFNCIKCKASGLHPGSRRYSTAKGAATQANPT